MKTPRFYSLILLLGAVLVTPACITPVSEEERACPCAEGWTCCEGRQVCVRDAIRCESLPGPGPDTTPPSVPTLLGSIPVSPSAQRDVQLDVAAEPGAYVYVFQDAACSTQPVAQGVADASGVVRIPVTLGENAATSFHARARDVAGNASRCSALPLVVVHDGVAPQAPSWVGVSPAASTNALQPVLSGIAEPAARVQVFSDAACTEPLPFQTQANSLGSFEVRVGVAADATTRFHARVGDAAGNVSACSGAIEVHHDGQAPAVPAWSGITPASPSPQRAFLLRGTGEPRARVRLYREGGCMGEVYAEDVVAEDRTFRFDLQAPANGTLRLSASVTDPVGNTSGCAEPLTYVHDDVPPAPPSLLATSPTSPAPQPSFVLMGRVEPGTTVRLYSQPTCEEAGLVTTVPPGEEGDFSLMMDAAPNAELQLHVRVFDEAGNASACDSASVLYRHDDTPPPAPLFQAASAPSPTLVDRAPFLFLSQSMDTAAVHVYPGANCQGIGVRAVANSFPDFTKVPVSIGFDTAETFSARAEDAAGNLSACAPETLVFQHVGQGPAWGAPTDLDGGELVALAVDEQERAWVLHKEYPFASVTRLVVRRQLADGGWDGETELLTTYSPLNFSPLLAVDGQGRAAAAVVSFEDDVGYVLDVHRFAEDTGWSAAERIGLLGTAGYDRAIGMDGDGHTFVAWRQGVGGSHAFVRRHVPGSGWEPAHELPGDATQDDVDLVVHPGGDAIVTWGAYGAPFRHGFVSRFQRGTGWSAPTRLTTELISPIYVSLDASGRALAVWQEYVEGLPSRLRFSRQEPGGEWMPPEILVGAAGSELFPMALDVNSRGEALAAWVQGVPGNGFPPEGLRVSRFTPEQGWSPPSPVPAHPSYLLPVGTAMMEDGTGYVFTNNPLEKDAASGQLMSVMASRVDARGIPGLGHVVGTGRFPIASMLTQTPAGAPWVGWTEPVASTFPVRSGFRGWHPGP